MFTLFTQRPKTVSVISGCTKVRFASQENHRHYCARHNYTYIWDQKERDIKSPYDHKLRALLDLPIDNKWWFWVDDDAFFTQMQTPLQTFLNGLPRKIEMVFANSPINPKGGWTFLSSGNFFFKNTQRVHDFFQSALDSDLVMIRQWWDADKYGMFTKGDQDKIVYQLVQQPEMMERTKIVGYDTFNWRPYHFHTSHDEHFLSHFAVPGVTKLDAIEEFRSRWNFPDSSLIFPEVSSQP